MGVSKLLTTSVNHELRLLRHAFNLAIKDWELIEKSPFAKIKIPSGKTKRVRYLSDEEEKNLFKILPDWLKPIVIIKSNSDYLSTIEVLL